ncbi:MAG: DUF2079 domain-containing protein, partial [Flavobacteriales bacterium]
ILLGGIGVYLFFKEVKQQDAVALFAATYFYAFFGVLAAVSFDYHSNVVATALIPWLFLSVAGRKMFNASILLLLIIVSKENISLWLAFICIGLSVEYRNDRYRRTYLVSASVICMLVFVFITSYFMPFISNNGHYPHFEYGYLGSTASEAFVHLVSHPIESIKALFTNHIDDPNGNYVKAELHILLLVSGLPFLSKK